MHSGEARLGEAAGGPSRGTGTTTNASRSHGAVRRLAVLCCIGLAASAIGARADDLRTVSDDRLSGRLISLSEGSLAFRHASGRLLTLPPAAIASLTTSRAVVIRLANGDRMVGTIERVSAGEWLVHSPHFGDQHLRWEEIAEIAGDDAEDSPPRGVAGREPPAEPPPVNPAAAAGGAETPRRSASAAPAARRAPRPPRRPHDAPGAAASVPPHPADRGVQEQPPGAPPPLAPAVAASVTGRGDEPPAESPPSSEPSEQQAPEGAELLFLRQQAVLLPQRGVEADVELSYLRNEANYQNDKAVIFTPTIRSNLLPDLEGFVTVPVQWAQRRVDLGTRQVTTEQGGIGDIRFGLKYNLLSESLYRPAVVLSASATAPTGEAPYVPPAPNQATVVILDTRDPFAFPLGTGHWSATAGVTLIKSFDPVVVFGSIDYTHLFPATYYGVEITPGDRFGFNAGLGFAISNRSTIGTQVFGQFQRPWKFNGVEAPRTDAAPLSVRLSYTHRLVNYSAIEPAITFGLVEDSVDAILSLGYTYRF